MKMLFADRFEAGARLAERLADLSGQDVLILALPRGGVPVAQPIAERLGGELDVLLVRKLGVPGHEELAMGAIALGGALVGNREAIEKLSISPEVIRSAVAREARELQRRAALYRGTSDPPRVAARIVVVVDDGLATGSTALAALQTLRTQKPRLLVLAVPVAPASTLEVLRPFADRIECLASPDPFHAVGLWYRDFAQVSDDEVRSLLARSGRRPSSELPETHPSGV
jgi:predicted phosphoribosyltransferase